MKLASLKQGGRDGTLIVVSRDLKSYVEVPHIAPTLQAALDAWTQTEPRLRDTYQKLNAGELPETFSLDVATLAAPLPRAYQWCDGSAYLSHAELVRKARGAEMPAFLYQDPLIYQGGSDNLCGPNDPILAMDENWGIDLEAELAIITDDVPMGTAAKEAESHIKLLMLVNDVSLRNLIPQEMSKGFGFYQSKPATAFGPVAVTPDEFGSAWNGRRVALPVISHINGTLLGRPDAGEDLYFDFPTLIAHTTKTRTLGAGTIIGSGTVANRDLSRGCSCLAEKRTLETLEHGAPRTPYLKFGDRVRIEVLDATGQSVFGAIEQTVQQQI